MRIFGANNRLDSNRGRSLAQVIPDPDWPKHGSGAMPGRDLSDMVNLCRAKDAAVTLALAELQLWSLLAVPKFQNRCSSSSS